jgi:hypothetical protein
MGDSVARFMAVAKSKMMKLIKAFAAGVRVDYPNVSLGPIAAKAADCSVRLGLLFG